jgi:hypothetical protein
MKKCRNFNNTYMQRLTWEQTTRVVLYSLKRPNLSIAFSTMEQALSVIAPPQDMLFSYIKAKGTLFHLCCHHPELSGGFYTLIIWNNKAATTGAYGTSTKVEPSPDVILVFFWLKFFLQVCIIWELRHTGNDIVAVYPNKGWKMRIKPVGIVTCYSCCSNLNSEPAPAGVGCFLKLRTFVRSIRPASSSPDVIWYFFRLNIKSFSWKYV